MKFNLSHMAGIAEIIGAFAVVISLIYVGVQVNDSATAVRSASANDANVALQNWYLQIGSDEQTSGLFYEALTSVLLGVKDTPGMRRYWQQRKSTLHSDFADYVDELLEEKTAPDMDIYRVVKDE